MIRKMVFQMRFPLLIAYIAGVLCYFVNIIIVSNTVAISHPIQTWVFSSELFGFVYPLFCSLPFGWIFYYECKNGYLKFVHTRMPLKKYVFCRYLSGAIMTFLLLAFISLSALLISLFIIEPRVLMERLNYINGNPFAEFQIINPLAYGLLLSLWRGIIGTAFFTLTFMLSLISKHLLIILTGAFVYSILENFITAVIGLPVFSICTSFDPERIDFNYFNYNPVVALLVGPSVLFVVNLAVFVYYKWSKRKEDETDLL